MFFSMLDVKSAKFASGFAILSYNLALIFITVSFIVLCLH